MPVCVLLLGTASVFVLSRGFCCLFCPVPGLWCLSFRLPRLERSRQRHRAAAWLSKGACRHCGKSSSCCGLSAGWSCMCNGIKYQQWSHNALSSRVIVLCRRQRASGQSCCLTTLSDVECNELVFLYKIFTLNWSTKVNAEARSAFHAGP